MTCIRKLGLAALLATAAGIGQADAAFIVSAAVGGAPTGVVKDNLDSLALTPAPGPNNQISSTGISVNLTPNARIVNGTTGQFAAPFLTGSNGAGFGNAPVPGVDNTNYITSGSTGSVAAAAAELILPVVSGGYLYFGLLWGSIDNYNTLSFYDGATLIGTVTGTQALTAAGTTPGSQAADGTAYVNITSDTAFTRVVATSTSFAFEFDNVAYNQSVPVPEPATLALLGAGLLGLGLARRRRR